MSSFRRLLSSFGMKEKRRREHCVIVVNGNARHKLLSSLAMKERQRQQRQQQQRQQSEQVIVGNSNARSKRSKEVFSLYREILRIAKRTELIRGKYEEGKYIREECVNSFNANKELIDDDMIDRAIDRAKTRIYYQRNYGVAYERLENVSSAGGGDVKIINQSLRDDIGAYQSAGLAINVHLNEHRAKARAKRKAIAEVSVEDIKDDA
jgi:hypothetical protein